MRCANGRQEEWETCLDERVAARPVEEQAVLAAQPLAQEAARVARRAPRGQQVERDGQRRVVVHVVEPELRARELPLDVAVELHSSVHVNV